MKNKFKFLVVVAIVAMTGMILFSSCSTDENSQTCIKVTGIPSYHNGLYAWASADYAGTTTLAAISKYDDKIIGGTCYCWLYLPSSAGGNPANCDGLQYDVTLFFDSIENDPYSIEWVGYADNKTLTGGFVEIPYTQFIPVTP